MLVSDFDFELPEDRIALEPAPRGQARRIRGTRISDGQRPHRHTPRHLDEGEEGIQAVEGP